jgi:hypothetical protein
MMKSLFIATVLATLAVQGTLASVGKYYRGNSEDYFDPIFYSHPASFTMNDELCLSSFIRIVRQFLDKFCHFNEINSSQAGETPVESCTCLGSPYVPYCATRVNAQNVGTAFANCKVQSKIYLFQEQIVFSIGSVLKGAVCLSKIPICWNFRRGNLPG